MESDTILMKQVNILQSENKRERKKALETIKLQLECKDIDKLLSFYEHAQSNLIFCFSDKSDACREETFEIVTGIIQKLPLKDSYLQTILFALSDRFSGENVKETSEEVRLLVVKLLKVLIIKYRLNLSIHLDILVNILVKTLTDNDPKTKKESCETVSALAKTLPEQFHLQSESLIKPILQNLSHQHYRVRVSGINAIGDAVRYGNSKCVEMSCGPLAERLFDQNPTVRIAVARVVGMWLLELPDRYSFFHKLLPLMLTCLVDEIPEHTAESTILWNKAGAQYLIENENDLKDKMDFLTENISHYPENVLRPSLGCRTLVQRELSKYLPAVVRELDDWMTDVRVRSAQLLCVSVQHAEEHITQHLQKVLPALYRAFTDDDKGVCTNIERTAEMIGYFVPPSVYCQLTLPYVEEMSKSGALGILASIIKTSKADLLKDELHNIGRVVHSVCLSKQLEYQEQLLNTVAALISACRYDCSLISQDIFSILISVIGLAVNENIANRAKGLMEGLSICEQLTVENLYIKHTPYILEKILCTAGMWSVHSADRFVFEAILTHAGAAIGLNIDKIIKCLTVFFKSDPDPEVSLKILMALSHILVNSAGTLTHVPNCAEATSNIVKDILCPQLIWKAGRSAEVLRNAAVSNLVVALQILQAGELSPELIAQLIPLLLSLVEDTMSKTRKFAIISLNHIVKGLRERNQLSADQINSIWPVVIKRLDDNHEEVRHIAVKSLCTIFCLPMPVIYVEHYQSNLESVYSEMLIHLNDPEYSFQEIMLDCLKKMAVVSPQLLKNEILKQSFSDTNVCKRLLLYLDNL